MMRPKDMSRIRIAGAKSLLRSTVEALYSAGILHMLDSSEEGFDRGMPFDEATKHSETLVRLGSISAALGIKGEAMPLHGLKAAEERFVEFERNYSMLAQKIAELKADKAAAEQRLSAAMPLKSLGISQQLLQGYSNLRVFKGYVKRGVRQFVDEATKDYELIEAQHNKRTVIALFVPAEHADAVQKKLSFASFEPMPEATPEASAAESGLHALESSIEKHESELGALKVQHSQFLLDYEAALNVEVEKSEAPLRFSTSKNAFLIEGWVPTKKLAQLEKLLESKTSGSIFVERLPITKDAPIALDNPALAKPFEFFINLYTLPKTTELDPTLLMLFTFPFFFGFMLGDIGYGIVTLSAFAFLRAKAKPKTAGRMLLNALILASISSIIFGFVFGEFFGAEIFGEPMLNRAHDINTMLMLTIAIGLLHVNLGFILGFYNKLKQHGFLHALLEKGSWLLLEAGAVLLALPFLGIETPLSRLGQLGIVPGAIVLLAAIAMLYKGEGVKGLVELPSLLSNILSYTRLFAIGLASVELAAIINEIAGSFMEAGGLMVIAAIAIVFLGHAVNIALGILGGFLHSLRLHYVEFFTKFFEGGGKQYAPFGGK